MATYSYTLPNARVSAGTIGITVISSLAGLTAPTFGSLLFQKAFETRMDLRVGSMDLEQMEFGFIEDYSVHSEGFWYKVLNGASLEIRLTLDEGAGAKHLFWGLVSPMNTVVDEIDLTSGSISRQSNSFMADTLITRLKTYPLSAAGIVYGASNNVLGSGPWGGTYALMCTPQAFVASLLDGCYNGSYNINDVVMPNYFVNPDIMFGMTLNDYTNWYDFTNVYMLYDAGGGGGGGNKGVYYTWGTNFSNAYDCVMALCQSFGLWPVYYYDTAAARHRVKMVQRGLNEAAYATYPNALESSFSPMAYAIIRNQTLSMPGGLRGTVPNQFGISFMSGQSFTMGAVPGGFQSDFSMQMQFGTYAGPYTGYDTDATHYEEMLWQLHDPAGSPLIYISEFFENARYYNYQSASYSSAKTSAMQAMGEYMWYRLGGYPGAGNNKRAYTRKYPGLACTLSGVTSQANNRLGMATQINDGVATRNFLATSVSKDPMADETTIRWVEI